MNIRDLKISTRLSLGFAAMVGLMLLLATVAWTRLSEVKSQFEEVEHDRYPKIVLAYDIKGQVNDIARAVRNLFIMTEPADLQAQFTEVKESDVAIAAAFEQLTGTIQSAEGKAALAQVTGARAAYKAIRDRMLDMVRAGQLDAARPVLLQEMRPAQLAYMARLDDLIQLQQRLMAEAGEEVDRAADSSHRLIAVLVALSVALAGGLAWAIIRATTTPIHEAVRVARAVSEGDLALTIEASGTNETATLLRALQAMQQRLATIVQGVRGTAEGVATASAQIAQGNLDLSSRTESQASALEQTAASMEELSSTVRLNADNAQQANRLASEASTVAVSGGDVVGRVVDTMRGIDESSRRIAEIIGTIDGIAFQTNILALNAAVEAARAGENGRGFAVVAAEVRSLAQRSAEAAKQIKGLITASVERVAEGSALVDQAGTTMQEVVASIRRVTDIMGEISSASREQSAGVAQVGEAVTQMDQATQQNAALVEESAAAAESLKVQAGQLVAAVAVFKL